ncbi:Nuclease domain-containing protein 1 [Nymphon striatum]|nr:Nuclease domain-containing protein 1 [Nymphon striatum]
MAGVDALLIKRHKSGGNTKIVDQMYKDEYHEESPVIMRSNPKLLCCKFGAFIIISQEELIYLLTILKINELEIHENIASSAIATYQESIESIPHQQGLKLRTLQKPCLMMDTGLGELGLDINQPTSGFRKESTKIHNVKGERVEDLNDGGNKLPTEEQDQCQDSLGDVSWDDFVTMDNVDTSTTVPIEDNWEAELMVMGRETNEIDSDDSDDDIFGNVALDQVDRYAYLGQLISIQRDWEPEVRRCVAARYCIFKPGPTSSILICLKMSAAKAQPLPVHRGIVKQVLSGDSVIIRGIPKGGPPPEKQICLSNISAPKLARRPNANVEESKDEPYAWEAREFLRKKLIGKEVCFTVEYKVPGSGREYGCIYLGKDISGENITEALIAEGLVEVRRGGIKTDRVCSYSTQKLCDLEDAAKSDGVGKHGVRSEQESHVRDIKWTIDNPRNFVDSLHNKPVKAVIEHVRDGCTVRAFTSIADTFYHVTIMMSGIRCPMFKLSEDGTSQTPEPFAEEAKYFTESRLLQRDVEIILESVSNQNFIGSVIHPNGSIAECLLKEGFGRCVDWSIAINYYLLLQHSVIFRAAKESRLRIWRDYQPSAPRLTAKEKEFQAKVMEIVNADAMVVKMPDGSSKKIFLASIRPPRSAESADPQAPQAPKEKGGRNFRPLYDVPYMFEAREFLRKKLIGKKVNVSVDYIQSSNATNNLPERSCCTVTIGGQNVAEALVSKGFAAVVRYRQDDDQRSANYDDLLAADMKAQKSGKGIHNKKDPPTHKVADVSGDVAKAKQFLPFLQRAGRSEGIVEFVASGSRLRLYIPRETCLRYIPACSCPKAARNLPNGPNIEGEPFGSDALTFTKELCLQREIWSKYEEPKEVETNEDLTAERKINYLNVIITEVTPELHFYAQKVNQGSQLIQMMDQMRNEFSTNAPLPGAYNPRRGDICAAKFSEDGEWYRAKVEKIASKGEEVHVIFIDYGNREITDATKLATLPGTFSAIPAFAKEHALACVIVPTEVDYQNAARNLFMDDCLNQELLLNVEYRVGSLEYVSVFRSDNKEDIGKGIIADGLATVENRKERRLQKIMKEYRSAEENAKMSRLNIWRYGDFRDDDAKEFGVRRV